MADRQIGYAVQSGNTVKVYDDKRVNFMSKTGELQGYSSNTVAIKCGNWIKVYDARGRNIATQCF